MEPNDIWARVFQIVRQNLAVPTVWLAMQAVRPLTIDGNYFVAGLPRKDEHFAAHLQDNSASTAIEDALRSVTGRILAFRLISGDTLADWEAQKALDEDDLMDLPEPVSASEPAPAPRQAAEPPPAFFRSEYSAAPSAPVPAPPVSRPQPTAAAAASTRSVSQSWEELNSRLGHGFKTAPFIKYPHGQAQYVLTAVKLISDTMDVLMPPPGAPRDDHQERMLAKAIERLGSIINLDPMFLSLELFRYREAQGKNPDVDL